MMARRHIIKKSTWLLTLGFFSLPARASGYPEIGAYALAMLLSLLVLPVAFTLFTRISRTHFKPLVLLLLATLVFVLWCLLYSAVVVFFFAQNPFHWGDRAVSNLVIILAPVLLCILAVIFGRIRRQKQRAKD